MIRLKTLRALAMIAAAQTGLVQADEQVYLVETPDYHWHVGCFGTASGNLAGYWDRHGFPGFYDGPTNGGRAPLNSNGDNRGITALWASRAGLDGRPADQPGHEDDYYVGYESTLPDPHAAQGRPEHEPDSIGDFIGLSQDKWTNMNGECNGNIDGYSFVYWEGSGERRVNFKPGPQAGVPPRDIPSGLSEWTRWRGSEADVFSQLSEFNPNTQPGKGFTFEDLKAEINAGYPVLLFMQPFDQLHRDFADELKLNPEIHGMLAYGYFVTDSGREYVRFRTSWASGDNQFAEWTGGNWTPSGILNHPLRGVIGYHPKPAIQSIEPVDGRLRITWEGPSSRLFNVLNGKTTELHWHVVEAASDLHSDSWRPVTAPTTEHAAWIDDCCPESAQFYRLKLIGPDEAAILLNQ